MEWKKLSDHVWRDYNGNAFFYFTGEILSKDEYVGYMNYIKQKERNEKSQTNVQRVKK
jgi:hypothetical protein